MTEQTEKGKANKRLQVTSKEYRNGYDRVFGPKKCEVCRMTGGKHRLDCSRSSGSQSKGN